MDRRRFLEISAFAAMAVPAQEATAMQSVRLETSTPAVIIGPDEAHVYSMLGGGEARLLLTGENTMERAGWVGSGKIPDS